MYKTGNVSLLSEEYYSIKVIEDEHSGIVPHIYSTRVHFNYQFIRGIF